MLISIKTICYRMGEFTRLFQNGVTSSSRGRKQSSSIDEVEAALQVAQRRQQIYQQEEEPQEEELENEAPDSEIPTEAEYSFSPEDFEPPLSNSKQTENTFLPPQPNELNYEIDSSDETQEDNSARQESNLAQKRQNSLQKNRAFKQSEVSEAEEGGLAQAHIEEGKPMILKPRQILDPNSLLADDVEGTESPDLTPQIESDAKPETTSVDTDEAKEVESQDHIPPVPSSSESANNPMLSDLSSGEVPSPDPDSLLGLIPQRELSPSELEANPDPPETVQAQVSILLNGLRGESTIQKNAISSQAQAQKQLVEAVARDRVAFIQQHGAAQINQLQASINAKQEELQSYAEQQKTVARTQLQAQIAQIEETTHQKIQSSQQELRSRRNNFITYLSEKKQALINFANSEADRADGELENASGETLQDSRAVANRYRQRYSQRAAIQVGQESAEDIRAKKRPIRQDLVRQARDLSTRYDEFRERVLQQIQDTQNALETVILDRQIRALEGVRASFQGVETGIDQHLNEALQHLDTIGMHTAQRLEEAQTQAIQQTENLQNQLRSTVDRATITAHQDIDYSVQEIEGVIPQGEGAYLPGIQEVIESGHRSLAERSHHIQQLLQQMTQEGAKAMEENKATFQTNAQNITSRANEQASQAVQQAQGAIDQILTIFGQQARSLQMDMEQKQQESLKDALAEVDRAISQAQTELAGFEEQFQQELIQATNDSLREAKKPLTDQVSDRAEEAAIRAGEPWWKGALRALGEILVGLVVLVVVALVVAAIVAIVSGVVLSAWSALMIAGAILIAVAFIAALVHRGGQVAEGHSPAVLLLAFTDAVGLTYVYEAWSGEEVVTGRTLSEGERTYRGITGTFTALMVFLGVRAGVRGVRTGPPGGSFGRPTRAPFRGGLRGIREGGFRGAYERGMEGIKGVGGEIWSGARRGLRDPETRQKRALETGAKEGLDPTPESIRTGEVRMEEHPNYNDIVAEIQQHGFEVEMTNGDPHVSIKEFVDSNGNTVRVERIVRLRPEMRFLDLEHELGHVRQMVERFGENPPPTERVVETPRGEKQAPNQEGILTTWQAKIVEYHNRLVEFLRLHERGAGEALLDEHAEGIQFWQAEALKATKKNRSPSRMEWRDAHFPDLAELESRYREARGNGIE